MTKLGCLGIQRTGHMSSGIVAREAPAVSDAEFLWNRPRFAKRTHPVGSLLA